MDSKFTHEEVEKFAKWLYDHGFEIYHGNCGSRDVKSDGFFWWSAYLVKYCRDMNDDEIEKNAVAEVVYEVYEQEDEDEYINELQYTFEEGFGPIEHFLYNVCLQEDRKKIIAYIESNSDQ